MRCLARVVFLSLSLAACDKDIPTGRLLGDGGALAADAAGAQDGPAAAACPRQAGDYAPPAPGAPDSAFAPCVSDDGAYHPFDPSISSVARVAAFDEIRRLLAGASPGPDAFTQARVVYQQPEGLDSRLQRREDTHLPAAVDATGAERKCSDAGIPALNPDRCVGPARMLPILTAAFEGGMRGQDAAANAARIEATLLWFLHVSIYKESDTCRDKVQDCDSGWAYYTGGEARATGRGIAADVLAQSPAIHGAVWDALLGVRCWRDLDNPAGIATDASLHARALAQLDRAADSALTVLAAARTRELAAAPEPERAARWAGLRILVQALLRHADKADAAAAATLRAEMAKEDVATVSLSALSGALAALACE